MPEIFSGFPSECLAFYRKLAKNNSKLWFEKHRADYEKQVLDPARRFVESMGDLLRRITPEIHAEPLVDRSIFRIYRDVRFSRDKRPFKTNLALWFWEGTGPRMECSGYYVNIEPDSIMLGVGMYQFPKHMLKEYRDSVIHPKYGPLLTDVLSDVNDKKRYELGGRHYKKTPRGYPADHVHSDLLLFNGLWAGIEMPVPRELFSRDLVRFCCKIFKDLAPLHNWLHALTGRIG